jgi:hypothetical protein
LASGSTAEDGAGGGGGSGEALLDGADALFETGQGLDLGRQRSHVALQLTDVESQLADRHLERGVPRAGLLIQPLDPLLQGGEARLEDLAHRLDRLKRRAVVRADVLNQRPGRFDATLDPILEASEDALPGRLGRLAVLLAGHLRSDSLLQKHASEVLAASPASSGALNASKDAVAHVPEVRIHRWSHLSPSSSPPAPLSSATRCNGSERLAFTGTRAELTTSVQAPLVPRQSASCPWFRPLA